MERINWSTWIDVTSGHKIDKGLVVRGQYRIEASGFIPSPDWPTLVYRFNAYPKDPTTHPYLVGVVRGRAWGSYEVGACFDTRARHGLVPITAADFIDWSQEQSIRKEVVEEWNTFLKMVDEASEGHAVPKTPDVVLVAVSRATGEPICSRFRLVITGDTIGQPTATGPVVKRPARSRAKARKK